MRTAFPVFKINFVLTVALLQMLVCWPAIAQTESKPADSPATVSLGAFPATASPRATMETFMNAMDAYGKALRDKDDEKAKQAMDTALSAMDLRSLPILLRGEQGKQAAVAIKEVIDRTMKVDYGELPGLAEIESNPPPTYALGETGVTLGLVTDSDGNGQYLISSETVSRARQLYDGVRDRPHVDGRTSDALIVEGSGLLDKEWLPLWSLESFAGLQYWQYLGLFLAILVGLIINAILGWLPGILKHAAFMLEPELRDYAAEKLKYPVAWVLTAYFWTVAVFLLGVSGPPQTILYWIVRFITAVSWLWLLYRIGDVLAEAVSTSRAGRMFDEPLRRLITRSIRIFILILSLLTIAQANDINVASIIAGLGVGGLAVALAAKDTLANFFGSVMIMLDKPFRVGDWVKVGDQEGTVEDIGFRSTRIRTFYNSLISVPSSTLAMNSIDNLGARTYRREVITIGVTYDTPPEKIEAFCEAIKNIILANPNTRKDYFHIVFNDFGASSLDLMLYFFVKTPDWSRELVERHNVLLEVLRAAKELGVEFAFPTQTVHIDSMTPPEPLPEKPNFGKVDLTRISEAFAKDGKEARPAGSGLFTPPYETKS